MGLALVDFVLQGTLGTSQIFRQSKWQQKVVFWRSVYYLLSSSTSVYLAPHSCVRAQSPLKKPLHTQDESYKAKHSSMSKYVKY